jgi:hypothetical protein
VKKNPNCHHLPVDLLTSYLDVTWMCHLSLTWVAAITLPVDQRLSLEVYCGSESYGGKTRPKGSDDLMQVNSSTQMEA